MDTIKATRELSERLNNTIKDIRRQKFISILFFFISGAFFIAMVLFLITYIVNQGSGREFILGVFTLIFFSILIVTLGVAILELMIVRSLKQKVTILENAIKDFEEGKPWREVPIREEEMIDVPEENK